MAGCFVGLAGCAPEPSATIERAGVITRPEIAESSGLAASRRASDLLWTHNDSDGQPVLYAIGTDGRFRGSVRLTGVKNIDWEDLASFELDGKSWLLVADVGDNNGTRKNCALHIIAEPDPADLSPDRELSTEVAWTVPVRYAEGPRDCESVAVDAREGNAYLLRKRLHPNSVYVLPLRSPPGEKPSAREVGIVPHVPQPTSQQRTVPAPTGRYRGQPTAMDFSTDGSAAVVLTYGDTLLFPRRAGESWATALTRKPIVLPPHALGQAEAICFSRDGHSLFVTEESAQSPVLRYSLAAVSTP
jgi:hypothetical protein